METTRYSFILCALIIGLCSIAQGAITNGYFEAGDLTGWNSSGTAGVVTNEFARDFLGLVQPPSGGIWVPSEGNYFASLWSTNNAGTDSSSLSRSFTANAGMELRFDYFFDFGDYSPNYDWATGTLNWTGGSETLFEINTAGYEINDDKNIDWTRLIYTLPVTGTYMLEFTTADGAIPGSFESILGIDSVQVIPAPGALILAWIGIVTVRRMRRNRTL